MQKIELIPALDSSSRIPELDGLRGLAILLVLAWHYPVNLLQGHTEYGLSFFAMAGRLTWSGVDLFFVLSGFLIGGILLDARDSPRYFKVFYIRRFCRIVPIYAVLCILFWTLAGLGHSYLWHGRLWTFGFSMPWYSYATFTQNFWMWRFGTFGARGMSATWSLAVEEQFYLTLPLLIRIVPRPRLGHVLGGLILSAPLLRMCLAFLPMHSQLGAYVLMPCRADSLLLGVLAALLLRRSDVRAYLAGHQRLLNLSLLALFLGVVLFTLNDWDVFSSEMTLGGYTWLALFYLCLLLIAVTQKDHIVSRALRNSQLRSLGAIAYGTYLFHLPILGLSFALLRRHGPAFITSSDAEVAFLALAFTFALATLSWRFFEKPIVNLSHAQKF